MDEKDRTFDSDALFGSTRWAAFRLGMGLETFRKERNLLFSSGFPQPDSVTKRYLKADVDAWISMRSKIRDKVEDIQAGGINFDAI